MVEQRKGRGRPPQVPATPREPIGRDRVGASSAPRGGQRRPARDAAPQRPDIPADTDPDLPTKIRKEIDRAITEKARARDVKACLWLGSVASEEDAHEDALRFLRWAKHLAPRLAVVREALGIALYRQGDLKAALTELQTYRRLAGSPDQNHLIADCMRDGGRELDRAIDVAMELVEEPRGDLERRVEAAIVAAAIHAEAGRSGRARAVLGRFLEGPDAVHVPAASTVRLLWLESEVAEGAGDDARALRAIERLLALDADYPDAVERRARLLSRGA
jgi:tetratricopeptide (TPR) repeat protein